MPTYSQLATPTATRDVLEAFGLATKKRLGQNFLISDAVIGRILELAELGEDDRVLEVGPGIGTLTVAMLPRAGALVAVEADPELPPVLAHTCAGYSDRMALIEGDAMKVGTDEIASALAELTGAPAPAGPTAFVSNLPYQVAATLVLRFMNEMDSLTRAVVMVQAEVAERMAAEPNSKAYGAYTAKLALVGRITGSFGVGPANFMPPPHVDSTVVRIERRVACDPDTGEELTPSELEACRRVIDAAFLQRRKTIRNSMRAGGFAPEQLDAAFGACGVEATRRAETLSTDEFIRLARELSSQGASEGE